MSTPLGRSALLADGSLAGRELCERYTELVESWLVDLFDREAAGASGVALVALGGQGRRELAPQSDLDLLLLVDRRGAFDHLAERLWYPIWDSGLKLGHAVRTVSDTLTLAADDLETATALLSARHLAGDASMTAELCEKAASNWRKRGRRWIDELARSIEVRHHEHGEVAFDLEPDLKGGRGGLRDVHALTWARAAGAEVDPQLFEHLAPHYDRLLAVRVELHRVAGRPGDRLLLQEQDTVATNLGYGDADAMMADVAEAAREIAWSSDEVWYDLRPAATPGAGRRSRTERRLPGGLVIKDRRVHLAEERLPVKDPLAVLRVALEAARSGLRIGPETLTALQDAPSIPEPWSEESRSVFVALLLTGRSAVEVIESLDRARIWERLVREWRPSRSRPQRNAYHRFTVDRHLLECAARAADLADRTPRPDLLVLGALLHDIGKGYPGDHSRTGELLASEVARRMGFTPGDAGTVGFLARHHLLLPDVATRRDLDDPATIRAVADVVVTRERLSLLHALTEADGLATGPAAWTSWKAQLVEQLTTRTVALLSGERVDPGPRALSDANRELLEKGETLILGEGEHLTVVHPDRRGVFCRVAGALALHGLDVVEAVILSERQMVLDRFRVRAGDAGSIRWEQVSADVARALDGRMAIEARLDQRERSHRRRHRAGMSVLTPEVTFDNDASERATVLTATGMDQPGLLYRLTRALADLDLDVSSAKIHTMGADVVDTFYVAGHGGAKVVDPALQQEIRLALMHVLEPAA